MAILNFNENTKPELRPGLLSLLCRVMYYQERRKQSITYEDLSQARHDLNPPQETTALSNQPVCFK
jgi:hypothetical protein